MVGLDAPLGLNTTLRLGLFLRLGASARLATAVGLGAFDSLAPSTLAAISPAIPLSK